MILTLSLFCFGLILLFGLSLSISFCGVSWNVKTVIKTGLFFLIALTIQIVSYIFLGLEKTKQLYPLITHLPLFLFLFFIMKRTGLISLSGILTAYLCLQTPKCLALIFGEMLTSHPISYYLCYIPAVFIWWIVLERYAVSPVYSLMTRSKMSCLLFATVPFFYYIYDYTTTVYTNLLNNGSRAAIQFMPSIVSTFYFVFVVIYYTALQQEAQVKQESEMIVMQLKQAQTEFNIMQQMQEQTREYRHDMRHHFSLLQSLAMAGDMDKILQYLQVAQTDLNSFTPARYCENDTVNLILSSFEKSATAQGITLDITANLPNDLSIRNTELCSLLSNSLENAGTAVLAIPNESKRTISIHLTVHKDHFLLSVENPYHGDVIFRQNMPVASADGHGYGTRSIASIAESYGGQALFNAQNQIFSLKVMIPLDFTS